MSYIGNSPTSVAFVTDLFNGTGSQTAFTMSVAPANTASVLVAVSGILQSPDTYSVSGLTLTFSAAPPSGTGNISARYLGIPASGVTTTAYRTVTEFTATAGQTTFTPPSYTVGYINVYRNGVRLNSADYTATNGTTVVLTAGATAGDTIAFESFYVSSVLGAIPQTAGAVTTPYILDGAVTQAKLASGVAGNGPAFSAYQSASSQSLTGGAATKVTLDAELFDTNNNFASSRFTPTVAGYYQLSCAVQVAASNQEIVAYIRKNNTDVLTGLDITTGSYNSSATGIQYANGTTDYFEVYCYVSSTRSVSNYATNTYFTGALVRSA